MAHNVVSKTKDYGPLDNADRITSLAKRFLLGTYHQYCRRAHLQHFLGYRFNRRHTWYPLASRLVSACALPIDTTNSASGDTTTSVAKRAARILIQSLVYALSSARSIS